MTQFNPDRINFDKMQGLVPAIVQDAGDGMILMIGYMNRAALEQTIRERAVVFWSRSKNRLWKKGETSGNILRLVSITGDCDNDALLLSVEPAGPVCHTGSRSCFQESGPPKTLDPLVMLRTIIRERHVASPEGSYTGELFRVGISRIGQKVGEEAVELAIAAQYDDTGRCVEEATDLLYHLLVLLQAKGIAWEQMDHEILRRMAR